MFKLITFNKNTNVIWGDIQFEPLRTITYRKVPNLDVLPTTSVLEFNCSESELLKYANDRQLFSQKVKEFYIPFHSSMESC
jgi:hypothetical protein